MAYSPSRTGPAGGGFVMWSVFIFHSVCHLSLTSSHLAESPDESDVKIEI